ncbi:immunoglobulin lambda-1 light chain-like [Pituophis catenifer annectens]|uniref:immunoglobulin lambda-1 light chain-like n=1 Tax=Pituophis catenifer annectens TaxID=94852 RepID=UPI0039947BFE
MGWAVIFLALLTYCTGIDGQSTWTQPPSSSVSLGETIRISCLTTQSSYSIGWNQQKAGEAPRFVHCDGCSNRGEGIPNRFTATRSGTTGSLTITNVQAEDEGIYFCVSWNNAANAWIFGGGTQLTVTGQDPVSPSVQVFAPSEQEIKTQKKATLVCLLSGFHPPAFELKWKVDGTETTSGVETTKATKQGDIYLASSYLTRSDSDYGDHRYVCEVKHNGKTFTKALTGSGKIKVLIYHLCASLWYIFGEGTQLIVTGQTNVSPSVQVFAPSQEEVRNPNPYTFVCLLTEFYPPAFELQWKVDDKVITSGVETTKASKQDGKYLASSYMKLTEAEYRDHKAVTCEVTHDSKTIAKSVSKSGSC